MHPLLEDLLDTTVTVTVAGARDAYGKAAAGASATFPARVTQKVRVMVDDTGRQITLTGSAIIPPPTVTIDPNQATIGFADGTSAVVRAVRVVDDETGPYYAEILFGEVDGTRRA